MTISLCVPPSVEPAWWITKRVQWLHYIILFLSPNRLFPNCGSSFNQGSELYAEQFAKSSSKNISRPMAGAKRWTLHLEIFRCPRKLQILNYPNRSNSPSIKIKSKKNAH